MKLSGGNYGGYTIVNDEVILYDENNEVVDTQPIVEVGAVTINDVDYANVFSVNGFLYSRDVSEITDQSQFIGMA